MIVLGVLLLLRLCISFYMNNSVHAVHGGLCTSKLPSPFSFAILWILLG